MTHRATLEAVAARYTTLTETDALYLLAELDELITYYRTHEKYNRDLLKSGSDHPGDDSIRKNANQFGYHAESLESLRQQFDKRKAAEAAMTELRPTGTP